MKNLKQISRLMMMAIIAIVVTSCSNDNSKVEELQKKVNELQTQVDIFEKEKETVNKNIETFKELDLVAFNNRDWKRIEEIHDEKVVAYGADGSVSDGMQPAHAEDLKFLFDSFPDYEIYSHSVDFGQGEWTAGLSTAGGTFTKPMKLRDGRIIEPTGKKMKVQAITLARWENGRIMEEYIFWDNLTMFAQLGIVDKVMGK